jgi:hypothetical protein
MEPEGDFKSIFKISCLIDSSIKRLSLEVFVRKEIDSTKNSRNFSEYVVSVFDHKAESVIVRQDDHIESDVPEFVFHGKTKLFKVSIVARPLGAHIFNVNIEIVFQGHEGFNNAMGLIIGPLVAMVV